MTQFFAELKRRNVYRAAVAYGVVAWFLTQLTTQVFPFFEIPNSAIRFVVIALAVGFPIAMSLSWIYEFTPEGIVRAEDLTPAKALSARRLTGRVLDFFIIGALLLVIALLVYQRFPFRSETGEVVPQKSIAVLPFADMSAAKDQEYFCDGISEELLGALSKVPGLRVVARTSSFSFKGRNAEVSEIAQKLHVRNVLEGSLRRDGNRMRISAQLIDARDGFQLWSRTYERELQGMFAVQDEITRSVVDALRIELALAPPAPPRQNTEAYDLYLQGLYFSNKSGEEDLRRSLVLFQRALDKDSSFARAWTGIAKAWLYLADAYVQPLEAYPIAQAAARNALQLDDRDAQAHCFLGHATEVLQWDGEQMLKCTLRALEIDPNSSIGHVWLGDVLLRYRRAEQAALAEYRKAVELDPLSPIASDALCGAYLMTGNLDDAIKQGKTTLQLDPNYTYLDSNLATAYREKGLTREAIELYMRGEQSKRSASGGLAITYARSARTAEAEQKLAELLTRRKTQYVPATTIAYVYAALGTKEEAFASLERAYSEHDAALLSMHIDPGSLPLRAEPRFNQLVKRVGLDPAKHVVQTP